MGRFSGVLGSTKDGAFFLGTSSFLLGVGMNLPERKKTMKTTFAMIAAVAAFTAGAFGAPAVSVTAERLVAVADEEKTVTLEVTGLK